MPDTANNRTFILDSLSGAGILSFNQASFAQVGYAPITVQEFPNVLDLNRWGADGFVFRVYAGNSQDEVVILRSSLTHTATGGTPAVSSLAPDSATVGTSTSQIAVTGSGFIPGSTVEWNGAALDTLYISSTQLIAVAPSSEFASANIAQVTVANPAPGGSSAGLSFIVGNGGLVTLSSNNIAFGSSAIGASTSADQITVSNTTSAAVSGLGIAISGADAQSFTLANGCGTTLAAGAMCTVGVTFTPAAAGALTATLTVSQASPVGSQTVSLAGTGTLLVPALAFTAIPAKSFGDAPFTVSAQSASSGAVTYSVVSGPATISGATVTVTGVGTVTVGASQAAEGSYASATATLSFQVTQGVPVVVWTSIFRRRRVLRVRLWTLVCVATLVSLAGCSSSGGGGAGNQVGNPGTPLGTYSISVSAAAGASTSHAATLTVEITQ